MTVHANLSSKQQLFVEALQGRAKGSIKEAVSLAGLPYDYARKLVTKPHIKAALASMQKSDPLVANREVRQRFWTRVMIGEEDDESRNAMANRLRTPSQDGRRLRSEAACSVTT